MTPVLPVQDGAASTLAGRLRTETRTLHTLAERAGIMPALLKGVLDLPTYGRLLENLHAIYEALERALVQHATHPAIAPICFPALFRQEALRADLHHLLPDKDHRVPILCAATRRYVARLQHAADQQPGLLVAHAYTRYLGDLSGGQALGRIVARSYGLEACAGTRFYQFGSAQDVAAHVHAFRAGLDRTALDLVGQDGVVAEAVLAFRLHADLFEELRQAS